MSKPTLGLYPDGLEYPVDEREKGMDGLDPGSETLGNGGENGGEVGAGVDGRELFFNAPFKGTVRKAGEAGGCGEYCGFRDI